MKKTIGAFISLFTLAQLSGQKPAYISLDDKHLKPVEAFISGNSDKLYYTTIEKYMGFAKAGIILNSWNGQFHTAYPVYIPESFYSGDFNRSAICTHLDTLYMAGSFASDNHKDAGIVKWNGTSWEKVGSGFWSDYPIHPEISVKQLVSFGNALWACGNFNQTGKGSCNGLVYYTQDWNHVSANGRVNDLLKVGDTLFAAGAFTSLDGQSCNQIAYLNSGVWKALPDPNMGEILQLGRYGKGIIALSKNQIRVFDNGIWTTLSSVWNYETIYTGSMAEYGQSLYISGVFKDNSGLVHHLLVWNGIAWKSVIKGSDISPKNGNRFYIKNINNHLYFGGNIKSFFGNPTLHIVELFPQHSIISGFLYKDNNLNCVMDAADERKANAIINVNNGAYYTSTNEYGYYELALSPNKVHDVRVYPGNNLKVACGSELTQIQTFDREDYLRVDIGFQDMPSPPPGEYIRLSSDKGFKVKHGFDAHYKIEFQANEQQYPFDLILTYPSSLTGFQTETSPVQIEDGKISWHIVSPTEINFSFNVNPVLCNMGDILNMHAEIYKDNWAVNDELKQEVVSAYDPNDKQCSDTRIGTGTRKLDYRIGFQNLGNAEATNVYVVDTISRTMPLQFLRVMDYSHKNNYSVSFKVRDHAVIWGFEDINLGAKNMFGEELSSGFISFTTGLENQLKIGDSITNQAAIYFDFQAPVFTNTIVTKVVSYSQPGNNLGLHLYLYPNPNTGNFTLSLEPYNIQKIEMYDLSGRLVHSQNGNSSGQLEVHTEGLAVGLYTVKVYHALGVVTKMVNIAN
jgi:hypothetical protein